MSAHHRTARSPRNVVAVRTASARRLLGCSLAALVTLLSVGAGQAVAHGVPFIAPFGATSTLGSTVPANGDQNPYGIVTVPDSRGSLHRGDILVSNFNNQGPTVAGSPTTGGSQGEGTTIMQFAPDGSQPRLFAHIDRQSYGPVGLTTALAALPGGFVVVGSLPTTDGTAATATAGGLFILNSHGRVIRTISGGPINGPWDMTAKSRGPFTTLFITNVLNDTVGANGSPVNEGTVVRMQLLTLAHFAPIVLSERVIATGFPERTDPSALVVGPTGVGLGRDDTLYVADSIGNRIARIPDASTRRSPVQMGGATLTDGSVLNGRGVLNDPLGLSMAPNGDILTVNGLDGNIVETTPAGAQVAHFQIDNGNGTSNGSGDLFGLTPTPSGDGVFFVDDFDNTLRLFHH